ncbi:hypothetical protein DFH29DRAFT_1006882 [Suillus ampliporus]|nr:hypothetical protein DFH29DRAFT_1006882 [Suillus ampliporus]
MCICTLYQFAIENSKGTTEVAVKVFKIVPGRAMEKTEKAMRRELMMWLRLKHLTMAPLPGIAKVESPFPALISQWMPSGTLYMHLEQGTITDSAKVELAKGIADGFMYRSSVPAKLLLLFLMSTQCIQSMSFTEAFIPQMCS